MKGSSWRCIIAAGNREQITELQFENVDLPQMDIAQRMRKHGDSCRLSADATCVVCGHEIRRTSYRKTPAIENMGIDHRRSDTPMSEQLLNGSDVIAVFKQVRRERMAERMVRGSLRKLGGLHRSAYGSLHRGRVNVVAPLDPGISLPIAAVRGENPLPGPF
jgi:hypothetical protein